jgi:hypothetical protein
VIKVKDNLSFSRTEGGSIVNIDVSSYESFVARQNETKRLSEKVASLESKLDAILELLGNQNGTN